MSITPFNSFCTSASVATICLLAISSSIKAFTISSLTILSLIAEIEDEFDVDIPATEIIPSNFNSAKNIWALIEKLKEE